MSNSEQTSAGIPKGYLWWAGSLVIVLLVAIRAFIIASDIADLDFGAKIHALAFSAQQDIAFVLVVVALFHLVRKALPAKFDFTLSTIATSVLVLTCVIGLLNVTAVRMLSGPLTMDWVRYSDIGKTDVILDSIFSLLPFEKLLVGALVLTGVFGFSRWAAARPLPVLVPKSIVGLAIALVLFATVTGDGADSVQPGKKRNPVLAFTQSVFSDGGQESLSRLAQNNGDIPQQIWPFERVEGLDAPAKPKTPIKNVVLFAFESTPAKQSEGWGAVHPVTPNLKASLDRGLAFDRAYAHVPASNYFLVSAFGAMIPELSPISMTYTRPDLDFDALPEVLNEAGFRTGFFNSSDNRFQNTETFAVASGFGTVRDYRDWECETGVYENTSISEKYLNTSSDLCTVERIKEWIEEDPEKPFFVAFRTGMTHYPYFPGENPIDHGVEDESYNTYLNALSVADQAYGNLLDYLKAAGKADETLVVVLGDHGEAFGEHGTYVHAAGINEENVHIPLALVNPQMFSGTRSDLIVGIKDIPPTITQLLGLRTPSTWQGESVFADVRYNGVMFFAPWNGFLIGYRHGNEKLIFNANSGRLEIFDLAADPGELVNLAAPDSDATKAAKTKLSSIVSTQMAYTQALIKGEGFADNTKQNLNKITIAASGTYMVEPPKVWVKVDGKDIGGFTVSSAISNELRAVSEEEVAAALQKFVLTTEETFECPKRLEIHFLNDRWAGENKTGDTDLWIQSVYFGGSTYHNSSFHEIQDRIGHKSGDFYRYSRTGGAYIDLYLDETCLAGAVTETAADPDTTVVKQ